eukprot:TRINITY_DN25396_c0_g1_i2.p1 TRINITY_DN25396_c0_g1~~TRINITY_DN25396_c0_g1_i2.p1  ORF type:complete len:310 (+),score=71.28 TRINITY_DN25396_c0_g1_i2:35-964(+)
MTNTSSSHVTSRPSTSVGFRCVTLNAKVIAKVISLLLWNKDSACQVAIGPTGLRVHMTDTGKSVHATALIRDELFSEINTNGKIVYIGVNLSHLLNALSMLGPGPQLSPLTIRFPGQDGSLIIEIVDGTHSTSCALAARPWDGSSLDLEFSKHETLVKATIKAELLKEVLSDLEQLNADSVDISFDATKQSLTFTGGSPSNGEVSIEAISHVNNQLLQSIEVKKSGTTTLSLAHISHTIKTDYFKDVSAKGGGASDHITLRINAVGTVCLLYHIKSLDVSATCGVECTMLPLFQAADDNEIQTTPQGLR